MMNLMGGFDIIMTSGFYQAPLLWDLWIFKPKKINLISLEQIFGMRI
jgi:hypothetical protein